MTNNIGIVCGEFHRQQVEQMLEFATETAQQNDLQIIEVVWVPGCMEAPLAATRMLERDDIVGVACLGIIEKGETQHGLAMGQAVIKSLIEAQLAFDKPVGLGIIGPGVEPHQIAPRIEPHARAAVQAISKMLI
jgi:6,7-dimethyl-8-ribityllumazine synthase